MLRRYLDEARLPIHILVFVAPLVVLYEAGMALLLPRHPDILPNLAHQGLLRFFGSFGVSTALFLPGLVLLVVLLLWQALSKKSWTPRWSVPLGMVLESALAALPLLVVAELLSRTLPVVGGDVGARIAQLDLSARLVVSLGAGLFEELVFRMLLIGLIHTVLVDLGRASDAIGSAVGVAVAAVAFAWYHPLGSPHGGLSLQLLAFYILAGVWFGVLFVTRGFGIAVGAHVAYDAIVAGLLLE
jgi:membrane protease YdiL (CAAX protease family)